MSRSKYFPFFCASVAIHIGLGGILVFSSPQKQKPQLCSFKERIVSLPAEPKIASQTPTSFKRPSQNSTLSPQTPKTAQNTPSPKKPPLSNPTPPPKPPKSSQKPSPSLEKKQAALKKLAQLANQLAEEAESQQSHLEHFSWPTQVQISAETLSYQQEAFCELFQRYVSLPFPGEVRIKLEFSKEGLLLNCWILSTIGDADKQHILRQIQQIPFQSFFNTYKTSKNIVFHIRLQGDSA